MRPVPSEAAKQQIEELRASVGKWLRDKRIEAGLNQKELAARAGFEYYTFISQMETGRGRVPAERYEGYAKALGIDPKEFAMRMLYAYENSTYHLLFPKEQVTDLERRLAALEMAVANK
ncbi:helix-turn-helix domain-containing protein [Pseudorhizobium flavum]|uniref:Transcriptional regulator with XRE-family HTH domain n=1 Tax=Pseudorhizobium flavum TaxID=1335061 RepID=A0A7W9Z1Q3_9HYPH|nr:helix-turn-helix transcriptional regulator [Pseudorhizobium flavum]MBB6182424.1 transcriptional regulator with XRE-family HTH domain [Pseudorhizobium flavum]CAD6599246.1 XRE family transcriptional regulator [Pseudorhizobium flavum]